MENMKVKDLKLILENLPDELDLIIPYGEEEDPDYIYGFRHIRTAGILENKQEKDKALCLNTAGKEDISEQVKPTDSTCYKLLF